MKKRRFFLISVFLFISFALFFSFWPARKLNTDENRRHGPSSSRLESEPLGLLRINSIESGEIIKRKLTSDPNIIILHHNHRDQSHYFDQQLTVKFTSHPGEAEIAKIAKDIDGELVKSHDSMCIFRSVRHNTTSLLKYFAGKENVLYAEPNYILLQNEMYAPNDWLYQENYQWNLPFIQTEKGWAISRGKEKIEIAVIDTGVDLDHPDLRHRLVTGYNVVEDNNHPDDDNGHGTHVAGIIAAETNNREGSAGITWYNKIMPIKALGNEGYGSSFDIAKGIIWAADHGADVINLSLGNYQSSAAIQDAVKYAYKKGVVLVAAAGNDNSTQPSYPAAYPEVLAVSAVDQHGRRAAFSNYGDYIDVAAPGVAIPSTYFQKQYAALSGTSMAAPHVTGLAGLLLSANPDMSNKEIMKIIKKSADNQGQTEKNTDIGHGLIDINNALQSAEKGKPFFERMNRQLKIFGIKRGS